MKTFSIADLFCGAGGTSTGAIEAAEFCGFRAAVTGVNHWNRATETFALNHAGHRVLCTGVDDINPRDLYRPGELDLLWASPECTHHSVARGGKPINEQSRATAWCVLKWADALMPPIILIENVPEFVTWGGLCIDGRPLKAQKGRTFIAWITALESLGYRVDWCILCAADYGDPTTRRRLFVQAVRGRRRILWPEPTHAAIPEGDLLTPRKPYRTARKDVIDWTLQGQSIYERKRPLSEKTMRRIMAGLEKYGLKPFLLPKEGVFGGNAARSVGSPLNTVIADGRIHLVRPFIVPNFGEREGQAPRVHSIDQPLPAVTSHGAGALAQPFLIELRGTSVKQIDGAAKSIEEPLSAVTGSGAHHGLIEPFILSIDHQSDPNGVRAISEPLSTISTKARHAIAQPYLVQVAHGNGLDVNGDKRRSRGVDVPLPTVPGTRGEWAVCEPSLLPQQSDGRLRPVSEPCPTVATDGAIGLVEPYLVEYYGTGTAQSIGDPLNTVTTKDRHALCEPKLVRIGDQTFKLDIRFRMLQPHELAAAQGFPKGYLFAGNKTEQVKQIGNAVPRRLARAIVLAVLRQ